MISCNKPGTGRDPPGQRTGTRDVVNAVAGWVEAAEGWRSVGNAAFFPIRERRLTDVWRCSSYQVDFFFF